MEQLGEQKETVMSFKEELAIISATVNQDITTLKNKPIIINTFSYCPYRPLLKKYMKANKNTAIKIFEFDSLNSILKGVMEDMGISLLPKSVIPNDNSATIHELPSNFNTLTTQFVIRKNHKPSHSLQNFIEIVSLT
jgi:DNA-binding transcriptional LysR family regulator